MVGLSVHNKYLVLREDAFALMRHGGRKIIPRYFFDIKDGEDFHDVQGAEFADLAAARVEAVRLAAEVLKEMPERFWNCEEWTMTVSDHLRHKLFTLKFLADSCPGESSDSVTEPAVAEAGAAE